ncbi:MAG: sulfatase-like hydrolase/transferase, partial [Opitutaceae bacterium]
MRPSFFLTVLLFLASLLALPAADSRAPNLIFLLADDIGIDWIGSYGADFPTPNIDRLAASGVRFETAWTNPICTPTRVMMLTGQYPGRTGWTEHYDVPRWGG